MLPCSSRRTTTARPRSYTVAHPRGWAAV